MENRRAKNAAMAAPIVLAPGGLLLGGLLGARYLRNRSTAKAEAAHKERE